MFTGSRPAFCRLPVGAGRRTSCSLGLYPLNKPRRAPCDPGNEVFGIAINGDVKLIIRQYKYFF